MAEKPKVTSAGSINVSKQFAANKSTGSAAAKPAAKTAVSGGYSGIPSTTKNVPVFTYGLGSSTQTKITKPGQTLPTTGGKSTGGKSTGGGKQPGVGKETGSTNTFIPGYTPSGTDTGPGGSTENTGFPAAGTFAGWEYSGDKKQRRMKFHDGQGGFYYGSFEANPDYKEDDEKKMNEKYMGFKAVEKAVAAKGARNPAAVAAYIGRKKYGKEKFQAMAAAGKKKANEETEVVTEAEGTLAVTPKEKELAAHHGDKSRITYGDVLKARLKSAAAKAMKKGN